MAINSTIKFKWKGKEVSLLITMRNIDRIEEDINLVTMFNRCNAGDARYSHIAKMISIFLNIAGEETTQEEVYREIFNGEMDPTDAMAIVLEIVKACFFESDSPVKKDQGKK